MERVRVREGDREREMSPAEFFELPLTVRVRLVLEGRVTFLRNGEPIDARRYLASRPGSASRTGIPAAASTTKKPPPS